MLKILIVGMGSIGKRHAKILRSIGSFHLAALRTMKGTCRAQSGLKEFTTVEDALKFRPDGVIIANPTSFHVEAALPFLEKKIKVLIEKPVAPTADQAEQLRCHADLLRVAYCMRFHDFNDEVKKIIKREQPYKLGFRRSFYLPKWHPYADYRTEYTARKDMGGGVIRTLSHEIDLMIHWFGSPRQVTGVVDKVSPLEIDTDDYAFFTCKYEQGLRVNFELDLFSPVNTNTAELFTEKGKYQWQMHRMDFTPYEQEAPMVLSNFGENAGEKMYLAQMIDFANFIETSHSRNATLDDSIETLKIIEQNESKIH